MTIDRLNVLLSAPFLRHARLERRSFPRHLLAQDGIIGLAFVDFFLYKSDLPCKKERHDASWNDLSKE